MAYTKKAKPSTSFSNEAKSARSPGGFDAAVFDAATFDADTGGMRNEAKPATTFTKETKT